MKERPILFSGPMVRALLTGTKTQTRRALRRQPIRIGTYATDGTQVDWVELDADGDPIDSELVCPYGTPGDRLWVRETFAPHYFDDGKPGYRADWNGRAADVCPEPKWRPSIFMRRHESRITVDVTAVRVERLQYISEADAIAEGCGRSVGGLFCGAPHKAHGAPRQHNSAREAYADLWDSINGKREGCAWSDNPWVWAVTFTRVQP